MYLRYLKFEFFEIIPHPRISLALERYAIAVYSLRAALVYASGILTHVCMHGRTKLITQVINGLGN
jgi:hypothetical protein